MEKTLMHWLINANRFVFICIMFTVATLFDLILTVIIVGDVGTTYYHLGSRFILCALVALSLLVFRCFNKWPLVVTVGIHFLVCLLLFVLYTWVSGFFVELHPRAYFYIIRTILMFYPVIVLGCFAIDRVQKAWINRAGREGRKTSD